MTALGRHLLLGLALALSALASAQELPRQVGVPGLLSRPLGTPEQVMDLTRDLAALGNAAIPELFEVLAAGAVPGGDGALLELDAPRVGALLGALAALSPSSVRAHLTALDRAALEDASRRAALLVYGAVGSGDDLRAMVSIAAPLDPRALIATEVRSAFREALSSVFARDVSAGGHVRGAFAVAHPSLRALLIEGLQGAESEAGLQVLGTLLGSDPELDLLALRAIALLTRVSSEQVDPTLFQTVRGYLTKGDERLVQAAVIALGQLRDPRAVQDLIYLLDSSNENLRASSDRALVQIAGRTFRGDRARWQAWYDAEQTWWAGAEEHLLQEFRSQHGAHLARALNEVAEHRLFRRELELLLVEGLHAEDPLLQAMACSALGRLGSRAALGELQSLVTHDDPRVVAAAREAYLRILGEPQRSGSGG